MRKNILRLGLLVAALLNAELLFGSLANPAHALPLRSNYVQVNDPSDLDVLGQGNQQGFGTSPASASASTFTSLTGQGSGRSETSQIRTEPILLPNGNVRGPQYNLSSEMSASTVFNSGNNYLPDIETTTTYSDTAQIGAPVGGTSVGAGGFIRFDWEFEGNLNFNGSVTPGSVTDRPQYEYALEITVNGQTQQAQAQTFLLQNIIGGNLSLASSGTLVFDGLTPGNIVDFEVELVVSNTAGERYGNNSSFNHDLEAQIVWETGPISEIPEPTTMTLLGLAALAGLRRKKNEA